MIPGLMEGRSLWRTVDKAGGEIGGVPMYLIATGCVLGWDESPGHKLDRERGMWARKSA